MSQIRSIFSWIHKTNPTYILLAVGCVVFFNGLFNGFVWDDIGQIVNNQAVHSIENIGVFFTGSTFGSASDNGTLTGTYYRPVMTTLFSILFTTFGAHPFFFHFTQIALYIINATLVFSLFCYFFSKRTSLLLSLIFLIHPINVENAVYISNLQEVLFMFFGLLATLQLLKKNQRVSQLGIADWMATIWLLLGAMLSKETAILFVIITPAALFLHSGKKNIKHAYLLLVPVLIYLFLRLTVGHVPFGTQISPFTSLALGTKLLTIPKIIFFYGITFIFPLRLSVAQMWIVQRISVQDFVFPVIFVVFLAFFLILAGYFIHKKSNAVFKNFLFFCVWFALGMGMHLQLFPLEMTVADRWFYFAIIGLLGILGTVIETFPIKNKLLKQACPILFTIILLLLGTRTVIRNSNWQNSYSLFSHDLVQDQDNFYLQNKVGLEQYLRGDYTAAQKSFERSIELKPTASAYSSLGLTYLQIGNLPLAESNLEQSIALKNDYYAAYPNLIFVLLKANKLAKANDVANSATLLFPNDDQIWLLTTFVHYKSGDTEDALHAVEKAISINQTEYSQTIYLRLKNQQPIDDLFK